MKKHLNPEIKKSIIKMNKENSSGQGAIPYRRYSPRPAKAADLVTSLSTETGKNSKTDSIVWMREERKA